MDPLVSMVVVNLNGAHHLPALAAGLAGQTERRFDLIFVDNASTDGSVAAMEQLCSAYGLRLTVIRNRENRGFAPATNQGIQAASGAWIVTLNNDTVPEPAWLASLLAAAESRPDVGMVASKMLFAHAPDRINSAGIALDWAGIAWDWRGGEPDRPDETVCVEIFGPCGGAALYRRTMLDEIGLFDDAYFAYMEDVDLAWRARLAGWRCLFQPQARILHAHSATLGDASPFKSFLLGRNKVWLLAKNYPTPWLWRYLPVIVLYDLLAVLYGTLLRRNPAVAAGRLAGLRGLGPILRRRRALHRRWRDTANWQPFMAALVSPWAVSRRYVHLATQPATGHHNP